MLGCDDSSTRKWKLLCVQNRWKLDGKSVNCSLTGKVEIVDISLEKNIYHNKNGSNCKNVLCEKGYDIWGFQSQVSS